MNRPRSARSSPSRVGLTRRRIIEAGLRFVEEHDLGALSMHKLGEVLGVKGMSLYNHVDNKDDLLNGVADLLWSKVASPPTAPESWHALAGTLAHSLRDVVLGHPRAAPLLVSSQVLSEHALLLAESYRQALVEAGLPDAHAASFLRTSMTYSLGFSLAELSWSRAMPPYAEDELARIRRVGSLLPAGAPDHLLRTAMWFCAECDTSEQFRLGLALMTKGLDASLGEQAPARRRKG